MKEKIKTYLDDVISRWRARWATMGWLARGTLIGKVIGVLVLIVTILWLAAWFAFGPPSVKIGDIEVDLDRSLSLAGTDKDANGIRDDVDNYIKVLAAKKAYNKPQVMALTQDARATQGLVTVDLNNATAVRIAGDKIERSIDCLYSRFNEDDAYKLGMQFEKLTANTKKRSIAYINFDHAMNGAVTAALPITVDPSVKTVMHRV